MPRRVLFILESRFLPSSIVRGLQFGELFRNHPEFDATFVCRSSDRMAGWLKRWPHRPLLRKPLSWLNQVLVSCNERRIVSLARQSDIVYLLTVPSSELHFRLCAIPNTRVLLDLIDALWLPWFRRFGWDRLEEMLASADGVICEATATADFARRHNARVFVVPDAPQLELFDTWRERVHRDSGRFTLGWIGGSNTADALYSIFEPLEQLFSRFPQLHLRVLGTPVDRLPRFERVRFSVLESYDNVAMAREALQMDVGLFPQFNVEESVNRGSLKAKIYMSAEAVATCQNLGENAHLVSDGVNGVLAATPDEWLSKLSFLIDNPQQREAIAAAGLKTIRDHFTAEKCFHRLLQAFEQVLD